MNLAYELFLLIFNLSQLHDREKILQLFIEGLQEIFKPATFSLNELMVNNDEDSFEIKSRNNNYGCIRLKGIHFLAKENYVLIRNAVQMVAVIIDNLDYSSRLKTEKAQLQKYTDLKLEELKRTVKELEDSRSASINLIQDLTDEIEKRKNAENLIMESEKKFRNLFEYSPVGKSMTSIDGTLNVNKSFCTILGYSEEELRLKHWKEISHPEDTALTEGIVKSLLEGKTASARFEKRYLHKNGSIVYTDVATYLQRNDEGNPQYFITTINDISERKRVEAEVQMLNEDLESKVIQRTSELQSANKELEAFSYSVSHDLRAPLRAIHSFTRILKEDYKETLDDEGRRICGIIETSSVHMGQLIDDLLNFSRIGRTELQISKIDMVKQVNTIWTEISTPEENARINFKVERLPVAYGDPSTVRQVLTNLISNAIKYSAIMDKPQILVGYDHTDKHKAYFVKDNGVGFDMHYVNKLFGVFQRLHSSKEFEGNGVGLAIVQRIIHRHGGKVWAEGEIGKGATFYFTLPDDLHSTSDNVF